MTYLPRYMQMILIGVIEQLSLFKILVEETICSCIIMKVLLASSSPATLWYLLVGQVPYRVLISLNSSV